MHWYLVHTKPRQERCALENLERQGFACYLPLLPVEKIRQRTVKVTAQPLFPRYLFIRLGRGQSSQSWAPIRSTTGVSRLVTFGSEPAKVDDALVDALKAREAALQGSPEPLFQAGDPVRLTEGAFAGFEGIYQMADGERRAMVLIELMSRPVALRVEAVALRRVE